MGSAFWKSAFAQWKYGRRLLVHVKWVSSESGDVRRRRSTLQGASAVLYPQGGTILPVYYCCIAALALVTGQWRNAAGIGDVVLHRLLIHNLWDDSFYALSRPFWTLAIQCQFYALFGVALPWLRWMARRLSNLALALFILALAVGAYFAHAAIMRSAGSWIEGAGLSRVISPEGPAISRSLVAHLPIFLLGSAVFVLSRDWGVHSTTKWHGTLGDLLSLGVAASLLAILGTSCDDAFQIPFGRYNWPYVPALLGILLLAVPRSQLLKAARRKSRLQV